MIEAPSSGVAASPYRGLRNFTEEDSEFFFGRERERDIIIANLKAKRIMVLYGASGVGKSSLLRAGVEAALLSAARANMQRLGTPRFIPVVFSNWAGDPCAGLAGAIAAAAGEFVDGEPLPAGATLADTIAATADRTGATVLVLLDQFEDEMFYGAGHGGAAPFETQLPELVGHLGLRARFLISVRDDAIAQLDRFRQTIPDLLQASMRVQPLAGDAARRAISGPLDRYNELAAPDRRVELDDELVDAVLDQVRAGRVSFEQTGQGRAGQNGSDGAEATGDAIGGQPGGQIEASYLQLVLATVWERELGSGSRRLRRSTLAELGEAETIVRTHLDDVMAELPPGERETAVDVFDRLVTPTGTKIALRTADLVAYSDRPAEEVTGLIEQLSSGPHRILRRVPTASGEPGVEIFHDVLAPAILSWRTRQAGARLEHEKQAAEERARVERRRARISMALAGMSLLLTVIAIALFFFVRSERGAAISARNRARSQVLAAQAQTDYQQQLGTGLLLAIEAYRTAPTAQAKGALVGGLVRTEGMAGYLRAHDGPVYNVAFDPAGTDLASAGGDGIVVVWNYRTGHRQVLRAASGAGDAFYGIAFSPAGRLLAAGSADGTVTVWNAATGQRLRTLATGGGPVYGVAFNRTGTLLATSTGSGSVVLFNPVTGERLRAIKAGAAPADALAFDPAGGSLAVASTAGAVVLWNPATGRRTGVIPGDSAGVNSVAFSPSGRLLATAGGDGKVDLWRVDSRERRPVRSLTNTVDTKPIESVGFSPDGRTIVAGGDDASLRTWNVARGQLLRTFQGHTDVVESVAFSPGGTMIASGGDDESVILWDAGLGSGTHTLNGGHGSVEGVAFAPNGATMAAANEDGTVSLWDVAGLRQRQVLRGHRGAVESVAFNPAGTQLAAAGDDGSVTVWNVGSSTPALELRPRAGKLWTVAFGPGGRTLAAGSDQGHVFVWDLRTRRLLYDLHGDTGRVFAVAFSPRAARVGRWGWQGHPLGPDPRPPLADAGRGRAARRRGGIRFDPAAAGRRRR